MHIAVTGRLHAAVFLYVSEKNIQDIHMVPETVAVILADLLDLGNRSGICETSNASRGKRHRSQNENSVNNGFPGAMEMVPLPCTPC